MVKQSLQQSLQQKLSPQQIQLMKLIELSTLELEQKVKDEIETNPALDDDNLSSESFDEIESESEISESSESRELENDFDLDQYISDDEVPAYKLYTNNASQDDEHEKAPIV
ncbi:MAG: RNA polymerase sigma-54 factor, partial [Flavobacteriales bacterium]|nr:RNA polymerase sigma-54 factor [Flavobacteriales bacterium]